MSELKEKFASRVKAYGCKNEDLALNYFTRLNNELPKLTPARTWMQVNFEDFLAKSIAYANIGIDPLAPKTLSFTLYANKSGMYDVVFVEDVKCMETVARKYGVNCPENITVELIHQNDKFSLIKKDLANPFDGYVLEITNAFDRGEVIGGVSLSEYQKPIYNKVRLMTLKEIEKRVNTKSPFWTNWKNEMCEKTIAKNAWSKVVLNTTELAEYYSLQATEEQEVEDLPFEPSNEL